MRLLIRALRGVKFKDARVRLLIHALFGVQRGGTEEEVSNPRSLAERGQSLCLSHNEGYRNAVQCARCEVGVPYSESTIERCLCVLPHARVERSRIEICSCALARARAPWCVRRR